MEQGDHPTCIFNSSICMPNRFRQLTVPLFIECVYHEGGRKSNLLQT